MATNLIAFKVSAPGKVILHGEHSVVYGKPAIAGAVGSRNFLHFQENNENSIILHYASINFDHKLPVEEINKLLEKFESSDEQQILDEPDKIEKFFIRSIPEHINDQKKKGLLSTLYLLCRILTEHKISSISSGFSIKIATELSVGAGLGSSASFGVCLAAAFLTYARQRSTDSSLTKLSTADKHSVSNWAFQSEKIMHGTPSGVDNTVCTFGSIVKFTKSKPIELVNAKRKINILLVDSKVSRSTIKMVKQVADLKEEFPAIVENILNAMEEVSNQALQTYAMISADSDITFQKLEKLFQINNDLLKSIGVSHLRLEEIFNIASANGFSSKITGAGGGGYALVLLPDNYSDMESYKVLCGDLEEAGFPYIATTVGGEGVTVEPLN